MNELQPKEEYSLGQKDGREAAIKRWDTHGDLLVDCSCLDEKTISYVYGFHEGITSVQIECVTRKRK
jgi:hypothetical protein